MGALSPSGDVRAFDSAADGTMFSDGAAVVALKRLADARRDGDPVLGVLVGFGGAADGSGKAIFAPRSEGQVRAMRRAQAVNGVDPADVAWVVGHGTATRTGDATELRSLATAYPGGVHVTSDKAVVGHTGMACGVVSVIQALNGLRRRAVPAQRRFTQLPGHSVALPVRVSPRDVPLTEAGGARNGTAGRGAEPGREPGAEDGTAGGRDRLAGVFACGLGGINAHLLLQHPDRPNAGMVSAPPRQDSDVALVGWSALLPGSPEEEPVRDWLTGGRYPGSHRLFGDAYPVPPFQHTRVAPGVATRIDRVQLLGLSLVHAYAERHGTLWDGLEERTGVFGAHHGPTRLAVDSTVRSFGRQAARRLAGPGDERDHAACASFLTAHARRTDPIGPYTLAGRMPCVALGWIANRHNLHGPTMLLDTGPSSGLAALHAALVHLRCGVLDLALVLGFHTVLPAQPPSPAAPDTAEGAFLVVLARQDIARSRRWPVHARLHSALRAPAGTPTTAGPAGARGPAFGAADGVVTVLGTALGGASGPRTVGAPPGPAVTVCPAVPLAGPRVTGGAEGR
ncbi:beta-ketoacyl synthase N-terminal-like domain-containing protein [Streptomyces sp. TRM 70351]|uniref:beta-ketoacyl synthase N-terminal-like domain-containing protein n=1 Tax=Streptomyces sp. TRM 70351 TaxID=3116552 RepID=UPI002E7C4BCE|nr:beta-ketoacyl synthase N-terminal-like domain-containing protein [Streptomyces sp. TRM 70351]MEE1928888.1 beta-ketoacyl synthase N-terminal-like domain-containing protein [Streptomyces sp. TRM 70351]